MLALKYKAQAVVSRFCKRFDVSVLYGTRVGVKCSNRLVSSDMFRCLTTDEVLRVPPEALHLGFDGLKDAYTSLGSKIPASPHFGLMHVLRNSGDVAGSDYLARAANGTLDFRLATRVDRSYVERLRREFEQGTVSVRTGEYEPIKVYVVDGRYYIADGKHRAAVCAVEGAEARCVVMSPVTYDSFFWWVYRKMTKDASNYEKHIRFFESAWLECEPDGR